MAQPEVVAGIVEARPDQRLIVVSAPGLSPDFPLKMTDILYYYAALVHGQDPTTVLKDEKVLEKLENRYTQNGCAANIQTVADDVIERYDTIYAKLSLGTRGLLRGMTYRELVPRDYSVQTMNYYASLGEVVSARYFAQLTGGHFRPADFIRFQDDRLDRHATRQAIARAAQTDLLSDDRPTIVPGFMGRDQNGAVRLLGRGGSDRTQVLLQTALGWDGENWTDVNGVFTADPRVIKTAQVIGELTNEEIREGAHGGSGVLQGDTILDLDGSKVAVTILNTFDPAAPGTRVVADAHEFVSRRINPKRPIVALSGRPLMELTVRDLGMADERGYLARLLHRAAELGISLEHVPAAQDAATFTIHAAVSAEALEAFRKSVEYHTVNDSASVEVKEKGVVYVVGEALRSAEVGTRTLGRIATTLSRRGLAFDAVVSHPQSPSLALLVDREAVAPVLEALHKRFIQGGLWQRIIRNVLRK